MVKASVIERRIRTGFTLVELLVVIAIIGILIGLAIPAVMSIRAAARRVHCANHVRQIGLAMTNYHNAIRRYPAGQLFKANTHPSSPIPEPGFELTSAWITLLPFIEQTNLFDQIDPDAPSPPNAWVA